MENDERFLRQQIRLSLDSSNVKYIKALAKHRKETVVDAGINRWRQGSMTGKQAIDWAVKHAKANYKVAGR